MSVSYLQSAKVQGCNDSFSAILRETADEFKVSDINVFNSQDYKELLTNDAMYSRYVDMLSAGLDSDEAETFKQISDNNRRVALEGASLGTVAPMSFLQDPMVRKSWARLAMPHALPTEAVEKPKFTLNYYHPWIMGLDGVKHYAPEDLADVGDSVSKVRLVEDAKIKFTGNCFSMNLFTGKDVDVAGADLTTDSWKETTADYAGSMTGAKYDAMLASQFKPKSNDEVDVNFSVIQANFKVPNANDVVIYNGATATVGNGGLKLNGVALTAADLVKNVKLEVATRVMAFKGTIAMEVEVDANCIQVGDNAVGAADEKITIVLQDNFYGDVDVKTGRFSGTCVGGKLECIMIRAFVSSVMNNANVQVGFDIRDKEVHIGTGDHLEAPVPNEYITDLARMFSFQGVTRLLEILSQFLAQKMDLDAIAFCDECISDLLEQNPGRFVRSFSAKPVGSYNLSPLDWPKTLTRIVDHLADSLINKYHFEQGYFVLLANPLDGHLLPEVNWVFQGGSNREHGGVTSNFSMGSFQGIHSYKLVCSPNVPQGFIRLMFIPTVPDQMTYKFFPYTYVIEQPGSGYNSPVNTHVPTLLTHRRYTFQKLLDCAGRINITNNSEREFNYAGTSPYLPTDTFIG